MKYIDFCVQFQHQRLAGGILPGVYAGLITKIDSTTNTTNTTTNTTTTGPVQFTAALLIELQT